MSVRCGSCGFEIPMRPGPFTTCPRCAPEPEVAGRIAAELVEAALARSDHATARELFSAADAWRSTMRARALGA